jgi:hypothetical protein
MRRFGRGHATDAFSASGTGSASATGGGYANSGIHLGDVIYQIFIRSETAVRTAVAKGDYFEAIRAICKVPHYNLAGILPFLSGHVFSAVVTVPVKHEGRRLKDVELLFIRQELQISVVALRHYGAAEWLAGGSVSETPLAVRTELLVCGPENAISVLQERFAAP